MEEASAAELITSPRISFSHDLPTFEPAATTTATSLTTIMSPRRRPRRGRRGTVPADEPEFDFANAAAADVAPADRLFSGGRLLPVPPLPPVARPPWPEKTTSRPPPPPPPRSKSSPLARSSSVNSTAAAAAGASGRFTCPAFPLMRSRSAGASAAGGGRPSHSKKVAPAAMWGNNGGCGGGGGRSGYYYGYGGGRINGGAASRGSGVRVSPVLNVTSIGTSVVNLLSFLLCDCGEKGTGKSRDPGLNCWVTR
ncbi:uncharacterized protein LOC100829780 [Brachypodium distachyon]|uniref:Uncharacterized protein n=1 Tax=Brachypodium distachyon TaxID=15368 RepID=I1HBP3_BRADI|nr:uncharacterized protein LOC100829780 [Brachypodium distachyon]KQK02542.2 hypothetical protein BRADI_2g02170v3 [Brachypodium distachyon]|eukprot:XP_003565294.1 uncharacterized protein LOC100829780 [Brachypodium distachyon]